MQSNSMTKKRTKGQKDKRTVPANGTRRGRVIPRRKAAFVAPAASGVGSAGAAGPGAGSDAVTESAASASVDGSGTGGAGAGSGTGIAVWHKPGGA